MSTPELDRCSRCGEHAEWALGSEGELLSACCARGPINVDWEPDGEELATFGEQSA